MEETIKAALNRWNVSSTERQKLQHVYLIVIALSVVVAGVAGLVNHDLGRDILKITLVAVTGFVINAVVWSMLNSAVLTNLKSRSNKR